MRLTTDTRQAQALCLEDFHLKWRVSSAGIILKCTSRLTREAWQMYVCKPYTCFALKDPKGVAGFGACFPFRMSCIYASWTAPTTMRRLQSRMLCRLTSRTQCRSISF